MIPLFYPENCENQDLPIRLRRQSLYGWADTTA